MLKTNVITACFLILSIFAQGLSAASAPCPMLDASNQHAKMNHTQMDHSNMDHTSMDHGISDTPAQSDPCCNDESCPMNLMVMGFTLSESSIRHFRSGFKVNTPEIINLYLSLTPSGLYRPPAHA